MMRRWYFWQWWPIASGGQFRTWGPKYLSDKEAWNEQLAIFRNYPPAPGNFYRWVAPAGGTWRQDTRSDTTFLSQAY